MNNYARVFADSGLPLGDHNVSVSHIEQVLKQQCGWNAQTQQLNRIHVPNRLGGVPANIRAVRSNCPSIHNDSHVVFTSMNSACRGPVI